MAAAVAAAAAAGAAAAAAAAAAAGAAATEAGAATRDQEPSAIKGAGEDGRQRGQGRVRRKKTGD